MSDELEIDYDDPRFNQGVQHVVYLLSGTIDARGWVAGDGSENYDDDLVQTLLNILAASGLYDKDNDLFAALPAGDVLTPEEFAAILWPGMFLPGWRAQDPADSWTQAHFYCLQKAERMLQTLEVRRKSP